MPAPKRPSFLRPRTLSFGATCSETDFASVSSVQRVICSDRSGAVSFEPYRFSAIYHSSASLRSSMKHLIFSQPSGTPPHSVERRGGQSREPSGLRLQAGAGRGPNENGRRDASPVQRPFRQRPVTDCVTERRPLRLRRGPVSPDYTRASSLVMQAAARARSWPRDILLFYAVAISTRNLPTSCMKWPLLVLVPN